MKNMRGEEVVRILRELVLREGSAQLVDGRRADDEQQDATNDFEDAVQALEDDCDREGSVEPVTAFEPVHRVRTWRGSGTASPSDGSCHRVSSAAGFRVELDSVRSQMVYAVGRFQADRAGTSMQVLLTFKRWPLIVLAASAVLTPLAWAAMGLFGFQMPWF